MFYQNFEDHVTRMYRLTIEGWPLRKLCSPSSVGSFAELEVLYNAWATGTARFRRLTDEQWGKFLDSYAHGADTSAAGPTDGAPRDDTSNTAPADGVPVPPTVPSPVAPTPTPKNKRKAAPFSDFVNMMASDGRPVAVQKKARQQRSDAGKARGPRKKKAASSTSTTSAGHQAAVAAAVAAAAAPAAHAAAPA
jgi:hypothetical protein